VKSFCRQSQRKTLRQREPSATLVEAGERLAEFRSVGADAVEYFLLDSGHVEYQLRTKGVRAITKC
jgi:hypothetical protein